MSILATVARLAVEVMAIVMQELVFVMQIIHRLDPRVWLAYRLECPIISTVVFPHRGHLYLVEYQLLRNVEFFRLVMQ